MKLKVHEDRELASEVTVSGMFKKFNEKESISGSQQLKGSVQKDIRRRLLEVYPSVEPFIDQIFPKKESFRLIKCHEHVELLANSQGDILFFKHRNGNYMPTLRLLHQYPFLLPAQQVDKGAIRFVLSGAHIMCPGLTSPGASLLPDVPAGAIVAITAEGKQHALAIGQMKLSSSDILKINKGVGIESIHYLNDGLWQLRPMK
ncbi:hypothetical protein M513_06669 [Trichuris suis]|uniref:PUA domain-containing protein n=1 Tax=Trichuris suis TaxID=68888 RepID=A0A085M5H6_9BILA|nr:hypothetical protein M513_06669 [Trichuris suis]